MTVTMLLSALLLGALSCIAFLVGRLSVRNKELHRERLKVMSFTDKMTALALPPLGVRLAREDNRSGWVEVAVNQTPVALVLLRNDDHSRNPSGHAILTALGQLSVVTTWEGPRP